MFAPRTCAAPAGGRAPPSRCSTSASGSGNTSASASARPKFSASANPNASASANPSVNDSARVDIGHRKALAQTQPLWQHEELETSDARDRCGRGPPAIALQCGKRSLWRAAASFQGSLRPPRLGALAIATGTLAQTQETESPTSSSSSSPSLPSPALSYFKARATCCERRRNLYFEESLARRAPWRTPRRSKTTSRQWWIS